MRGHFQELEGSLQSSLKDNQNRLYLVMGYRENEYKHLQKDVFYIETYPFIKS